MGEPIIVEVAVIIIASFGGIPVRIGAEVTAPMSGKIYSGEFTVVDTLRDADGETWVQIEIYDGAEGWLRWDYENKAEMRLKYNRYAYEIDDDNGHRTGELHNRDEYIGLVGARGLAK